MIDSKPLVSWPLIYVVTSVMSLALPTLVNLLFQNCIPFISSSIQHIQPQIMLQCMYNVFLVSESQFQPMI